MAGTGIEAEVIGTETHVGEAAPEVLEEAIMIDVQVRIIPSHFGSQAYWKQRETEGTTVTTIGGTLIDEKGMIVEETTGGTTMTATGLTLGTEIPQNILRLSLP